MCKYFHLIHKIGVPNVEVIGSRQLVSFSPHSDASPSTDDLVCNLKRHIEKDHESGLVALAKKHDAMVLEKWSSLVENMAKRNRNCFSIAVFLTTLIYTYIMTTKKYFAFCDYNSNFLGRVITVWKVFARPFHQYITRSKIPNVSVGKSRKKCSCLTTVAHGGQKNRNGRTTVDLFMPSFLLVLPPMTFTKDGPIFMVRSLVWMHMSSIFLWHIPIMQILMQPP